MVIYLIVNQVDSCHGCVRGPLTWDTKDILWMDDRGLTSDCFAILLFPCCLWLGLDTLWTFFSPWSRFGSVFWRSYLTCHIHAVEILADSREYKWEDLRSPHLPPGTPDSGRPLFLQSPISVLSYNFLLSRMRVNPEKKTCDLITIYFHVNFNKNDSVSTLIYIYFMNFVVGNWISLGDLGVDYSSSLASDFMFWVR